MAKKITLANLDSGEKKKLGKVTFASLFSVFVLCIFIVSCFACSQNPGGQVSKEQQAAADKLYWKDAVAGTKWVVSTSARNDGKLEGQTLVLDLEITYEKSSDKLYVYFSSGGVQILNGELTLQSSEGKIAIVDGKNWNAKFSEKNDIKYLTISCSNGKDVYYTCGS